MERRDFIKLCSMTGLAVVAGAAASQSTRSAHAEVNKYTGPLHLFVHQGGGWDVTSICDPKGGGSQAEIDTQGESDVMNHYLTSDIHGNVGGVRWAPMETIPQLMQQNNVDMQANNDFFTAFASRLTVINGIDMMTNSHDVGTRAIWAGDLTEGRPTVAALIAAHHNPESPMAFVSFGGYDQTGGTIAATRLGNVDAIKRLAFPYRRDPDDEMSTYFSEETVSRIAVARQERFDLRMKSQRLPRIRTALSTLYLSRLGQNELKQLVAFLPDPDNLEQGIAGAVQLVIAAYKAGLCVTANLSSGGWDTHGNNDQSVVNAQANLFGTPGAGPAASGMHRVMGLIDEAGIADNALLYFGSDFGRTPGYNMGNGKDHFAVSSMMVMGAAGGKQVKGDRVVGMTTEGHQPIDMDPTTFAEQAGGARIKPGHIQNAIRKLAGIEGGDVAKAFPTTESKDEFVNLIELA